MFQDPRPVDSTADAAVRLTGHQTYEFSSDQTSALLGLSEIFSSAKDFPVLFAEIETGTAPVALLGLPGQGNTAVQNDVWTAKYIPAVFRTYPFLLAQTDEAGERFAICLERTAPHIAKEGEEGEPLFTEEGEPSPLMERAKAMLQTLHSDQVRGLALGKLLKEQELLSPFAIAVTQDNQQKTLPLEGLFFIEEKKLNNLSDEDFCELRSVGALPAIYAHLLSLTNVERIIRHSAQ